MPLATALESIDALPLPQAARVVGVSPPTLRTWILEGRIHAFRIARMIFVRREDLDSFLAQRESRTAVSA